MQYAFLAISAIAALWDALTTVYGTVTILGEPETISHIMIGVLFGALILIVLLNTRQIFARSGAGSEFFRIFWTVALVYDTITAWQGNRNFIFPGYLQGQQQILLVGLTAMVSGSPILCSYLMHERSKS